MYYALENLERLQGEAFYQAFAATPAGVTSS